MMISLPAFCNNSKIYTQLELLWTEVPGMGKKPIQLRRLGKGLVSTEVCCHKLTRRSV
jgi:hypothetical protein